MRELLLILKEYLLSWLPPERNHYVSDEIDPIDSTVAWLWSKNGTKYEIAAAIIRGLREQRDSAQAVASTNAELVKDLYHQLAPVQQLVFEIAKQPCSQIESGKECWISDDLPLKVPNSEMAMCFSCKARYIVGYLKLSIPISRVNEEEDIPLRPVFPRPDGFE